jgi:hypothetical protein
MANKYLPLLGLLVLLVLIGLLVFSTKNKKFRSRNDTHNIKRNNTRNDERNNDEYKYEDVISYPKWPIGTLENNQEKVYRNFYNLNDRQNKPYNTDFETTPNTITSLTPVSIPDLSTYLDESYINGYKLVEQNGDTVKFGNINLTSKPICKWVKIGYLSPNKTFLDEDKNIFTLYRMDTDKQNEYRFKAVLLDGSEILFPPEINFVRNQEILPYLRGTEFEKLGSMRVSLDRSFTYNFTY